MFFQNYRELSYPILDTSGTVVGYTKLNFFLNIKRMSYQDTGVDTNIHSFVWENFFSV